MFRRFSLAFQLFAFAVLLANLAKRFFLKIFFFFTASLWLHPSDPCLARDPVWSFHGKHSTHCFFCDLDYVGTVLALTNLDYSILQRALYFCRILSGRGRDVIFLQMWEGHKWIELPVLVHRIRELEDPFLQPSFSVQNACIRIRQY